jgi:WD40 repeat protein
MMARLAPVFLVVAVCGVSRAEEGKPKTDLYGAPLPEGAVVRLGSARLKTRATQLAFSPDGGTLITADDAHTVKHRDAEDGTLRQVFTLPQRLFYYPQAFSPDASLFACPSGEGDFIVRDVPSGARVCRFGRGNSGQFYFSADGRTVATADWSGADLRLWDARTGAARPFQAPSVRATGVDFSPDGARLAVTNWMNNHCEPLVCLDAVTGRKLWESERPAAALAWSSDGAALLVRFPPAPSPPAPTWFALFSRWLEKSEGPWGTLGLLTALDGKPLAGARLPPSADVTALTFHPDGDAFAFRSPEAVVLWDLKTGKARGPGPPAEMPAGRRTWPSPRTARRWRRWSARPCTAGTWPRAGTVTPT